MLRCDALRSSCLLYDRTFVLFRVSYSPTDRVILYNIPLRSTFNIVLDTPYTHRVTLLTRPIPITDNRIRPRVIDALSIKKLSQVAEKSIQITIMNPPLILTYIPSTSNCPPIVPALIRNKNPIIRQYRCQHTTFGNACKLVSQISRRF